MTTLMEWQNRWTSGTAGASWIGWLLPSIQRWIGRPPGSPVTYHLAQALTGHGAFNGIIEFVECAHCGVPVDDAEHTLFVCPTWCEQRTGIEAVLGRQLRTDDVKELLCGKGLRDLSILSRRKTFIDMVEEVMTEKKRAGRGRQMRPMVTEGSPVSPSQ